MRIFFPLGSQGAEQEAAESLEDVLPCRIGKEEGGGELALHGGNCRSSC